ncbi:MAG: hypothetical protein KAH32_08165 [Chlamydiia bacterium]|nr:hypothetical protein [Chlamydiia bacterium]
MNLNCKSDVIRYSDDKIVGIGFNGMFSFTRCNSCDSIMALNDKTSIYDDTSVKNIVKDKKAIEASYPNLEDCIQTLEELTEGNTNDIGNTEFVVRKHIIWIFNDRVRQGLPIFENQENFDKWYDNVLKILDNNNLCDERGILLKVEIYRYLGKFEEAENTLSLIKTPDSYLQYDIDEVRDHIEKNNREVFISKYKF